MDAIRVIETEKRLLGALMLNGSARAEVAEVLKADDFYRQEHKRIYSAILRLHYAGVAADARVIENELVKSGELEKVTREYFWSLTNLEHTDARATYYLKEILEASRKRRLAELGRILTEGRGSSLKLVAEVEKYLSGMSNSERKMESASDIALRTFEELTHAEEGLRTGFIDLDKLTGGLKKTELIILAARPSMGKTALGMNIAAWVARNSTVGVFSLEMSKGQLMRRLFSSEANINAQKVQSGDLREVELKRLSDAATIIGKKKLFIDDTGSLSLLELTLRARRLKRENNLALIVIDYLQLMQTNAENRLQEVSKISRGLKALAKELDVPVLALSQLSRAVEQRAEKKPVLSDLRESGTIEQDADVVMFLYRNDYYNDGEENIAEVMVAKNRNGATGSIRLFFDKPTVTFRNLFRRLDD